MRRTLTLAATFAAAGVLLLVTPALAALGEGESDPSFNESWGCGAPGTLKPFASRKGFLTDSEPIRGPAGDFFGRNVGEIRDSLVWWRLPMTGGNNSVLVHERALPAFEQVTANLAAEEAKGNYYPIRPHRTGAFSARTIRDSYRFSFHAFGNAIDVNSDTNPYRANNVLATDMPPWFVKAWTDAGFCWGGDWQNIKDAMHFSWMGPAATPGYPSGSSFVPVHTNPAPFSALVENTILPYGTPDPQRIYAIADANGDDAADVFQLTQKPNGILVEHARSSRGYDWCAVERGFAGNATIPARGAVFGDYEGRGRNDLWLIGEQGGVVSLTVRLRSSDFEDTETVLTGISVAPNDVYIVGDHDRDGRGDLYVVRRSATATIVEVYLGPDFGSAAETGTTALGDTTGSQWHFSTGDQDLDDIADLYAIESGIGGSVTVLSGASSFSVIDQMSINTDQSLRDVSLVDYDGDGRNDLQVYTSGGRLRVYLGNDSSYADRDGWFVAPDWTCPANAEPYEDYDGSFRDDDGNVHEPNIEVIAAAGITRGCNPPYNDEYCPRDSVTRGQMAAFIVRLLGLTATGGKDWFIDDNDSIFEGDINRLAAAGITRGCDIAWVRYCPERVLTRAEFAAFVARAIDLPPAGQDYFTDDAGHQFENDINRMAAAGITLGCNPPTNDRYCPSQSVRRDEMASFFARILSYLAS